MMSALFYLEHDAGELAQKHRLTVLNSGDLVVTQISKLVQGSTRQLGHGDTVQIAPGIFKGHLLRG